MNPNEEGTPLSLKLSKVPKPKLRLQTLASKPNMAESSLELEVDWVLPLLIQPQRHNHCLRVRSNETKAELA
jgi:hypothetical protein